MKHWDGRDRDDASLLRLPQRDAQRVRDLFAQPPPRRRQPPHVGSLIGLALALFVLAGLAWGLSPAEPVSPAVMN